MHVNQLGDFLTSTKSEHEFRGRHGQVAGSQVVSRAAALEFYGTGLGTWSWLPVVPLLGLPAANPPAAIGVGYCIMDAAARQLAPRLRGALARVRRAPPPYRRRPTRHAAIACGSLALDAQPCRSDISELWDQE